MKHLKTVKVLPNDSFSTGAGGDLLYLPAKDRMILILTTKVDQPVTLPTGEVCNDKVVGYVEFTTDMLPTGNHGYLACGFADLHSLSVGNDVYFAMMRSGGPGYSLKKFDGVTWNRLSWRDVAWVNETEWGNGGGPDPSYINGQFVVTSEYLPGGKNVGGSHSMIFTSDLTPVRTVLLYPPEVPPARGEYSLLQVSNGDILLFGSAGTSKGNLEVLRFDKDWHFLDQRWLRDHAVYPNGSATDGTYVFVAYLDWKQEMGQQGQNAGLAVFDAQWNLVKDVVLTDVQSMGDLTYAEDTSIAIRGNRIYVAYNIHTLDPATGMPDGSKSQTFVDVFELD